MSDDRNVDLKLTATDDASSVIGDVADRLEDLPDETTVDVDADTRDALSRIETFDREITDLTGDARELRILFRAEQLQRDVSAALRDLERLEDPVDIRTRTEDLETAQADLRELAELADRKYSIEIDADPKRSARQAADDLETMRTRADGFQSATPALRGFTDELGATAQAAGVTGQALGDLGDFSLIMGEKMGLSAGAAVGLGTALGAAGLATIILGTAIPALKKLGDEQEIELATAEDLLSVHELLAKQMRDDAARKLAEDYADLIDKGREFGLTAGDVIGFVADETARLAAETDDVDADRWRAFREAAHDARTAFGDAGDTLDGYSESAREISDLLAGRFPTAAEDAIAAIKETEEGILLLEAAQIRLGENATPEQLVAEYENVKAEVDAFREASNRATDDAAAGFADVESAYAGLIGALSDRSAYLNLGDAFDRVETAAEDAWTAAGEGADDADAKVRDHEQSVIDLKNRVIDYADAVDGIDPEVVTEILADIDEGSLDEAERKLADLERDREATVRVKFQTPAGFVDRSYFPGVPSSAATGLAATRDAVPSATLTAPRTMVVNVRTDAGMRQVDRAITRWRRINGTGR